MKEIDIQVHKAQRVPNKLDPKRTTPGHIIIKMPKLKDKGRTLRAAREIQTVTYKGVPMRLSADFSKETLQARRDLQGILKVTKSRVLQPRLLYPAKISFRIKGEIKSSSDKKKIKGVHCLGLRGSQRGPPIYLQRMKRDGTGGAKERQQDKGF